MRDINLVIILLASFFIQSCAQKECIELEDNSSTAVEEEVEEEVVIESCEGVFYSGHFGNDNNGDGQLSHFLDTFSQPISTPFSSTVIEERFFNSSYRFLAMNFSAYDQMNDRYAYFYYYDDEPVDNTLYLADTNPINTISLAVVQNYAAPVFLNGDLYSISAETIGSNLSYEILQIDQSTGVGASIFSDIVAIDGFFTNVLVSSATNSVDTIYFLGVKTLIAYNVVTGSSQVFDIDIQYDADIQTALSGLEYRTVTDQLIAIHHKFNSPNDINEVISINPVNGTYESLYDLEDNIGIGLSLGEPIELAINSTTYSACDDTYYITELTTTETEPIENTILEINLANPSLTKRITEEFIYGITVDETQ